LKDGSAMTAPVVLFSFNRPDATRQTLERIRQAAPAELFLVADGPRAGNAEDAQSCAAVRRELENIDWPCNVHRRYSEANRGVDATIELGLDWVFDQVEEAIVLEDDCIPHPDFFAFCSELLEHYRGEARVWQICGRAPTVPEELFGGASYCFTAVGPIWGWATWRRAWLAHRRRFPRAHDGGITAPGHAVDLEHSLLITGGGRRYFRDVMRDRTGREFLWDSQWCLSVVGGRGLVALPKDNLIENIGFGDLASNTRTSIPQRGLESLSGPIVHPKEPQLSSEIQLLAERIAAAHHGRAARFVARHLRKTPVRKVVRSAVGIWRDRRVPAR
jgi:hypothetical protein